jgi:hypothetical protein
MSSSSRYELVTVNTRHVNLPARWPQVPRLNSFGCPRNLAKQIASTVKDWQLQRGTFDWTKEWIRLSGCWTKLGTFCVSTQMLYLIEGWPIVAPLRLPIYTVASAREVYGSWGRAVCPNAHDSTNWDFRRWVTDTSSVKILCPQK